MRIWLPILGAGVLLAAGLGIFISRLVLRQLGGDPQEVVDLTRKVAMGDLSMAIDTRGKNDESLIVAMQRMVETIRALVADVLSGAPISAISGRFHSGLAKMVVDVSNKIRSETAINEVVLSGGVWQNITLLRRTLSLLQKDDFQVYLHREVPTNDGGLSLGQAAIATARLRAGNVPGSSGTNNRADKP